jgi:hypothetical protein
MKDFYIQAITLVNVLNGIHGEMNFQNTMKKCKHTKNRHHTF